MNSIREFPRSPVALIAARDTGKLLSNVHRTFPIPLTLWTCHAVNSRCYQFFLRYITPPDTFPRPRFIIAPWHRGLPKGIFEEVRRLDKFDPNVYWIFAVDEHADVIGVLSNHSCQVVTVAEKDISVASDGYRCCSKRVTSSTLEWKTLLGSPELEGRYPRNRNITYTLQERGTIPPACTMMGPMFFMTFALFSLRLRYPEYAALLDAYYAINTTVNMQCAEYISGEALLREKKLDFILLSWLNRNSTPLFEYKYAFFSPSSLCFYVRARAPVPPSFDDSWIFFFFCFVCLAPFCFAIMFIFHAHGIVRPNERVPLSTVIMIFVSSFLGRSTEDLNVGASAPRLVVMAWSLAMFFVGNYLQSSVTASRSVPALSAEITTKQLLEHLREGTLAPCVARYAYEMRGHAKILPVFKPLARALDKCQSGCLDKYGFGCMDKARQGTHIYFNICVESERPIIFKHGLVVGEKTLASWQTYSAVHIRSPFRYQHRRLLMAVSESGMWMQFASRYPLPSANKDKVSFNMALHEYLVVLYVGLALSLVALTAEILLHRYRGE
ncbi:hypothetical protein HPB49_024440 [Dermacentor silvarum]|uniref:Uncharacterized protein n=1 Tax=Dermacentor silvarum TaxID=543639 RepID=A0ACB8DLD6_DERSI|nr:hypothetical protein HPB49_024440 [Dermacentor silvarum]